MRTNPLVISATCGVTFKQQVGQTLLDASIAARHPIAHSCHSAKCRQCLVTIVDGTTHKFRDENLTADELTRGYILACARTATSGLQIEAGELVFKKIPPVVNIPAMVSALKLVSSDLILASLRLPMSARFHYVAGQHVAVTNRAGVRRNYSMCCATPKEGLIQILIRRHKTGVMSHYWFKQAAQGDLLTLEGPSGTFGERFNNYSRPLMIAEKEGIAPLLALVASARNVGSALFWLGASATEIRCLEDELEISDKIAIFSFPDSGEASMSALGTALLGETENTLVDAVFVCGGTRFLRQMKPLLKRDPFSGLPLHTEVFLPTKPQ